jgi:hypothetical protein
MTIRRRAVRLLDRVIDVLTRISESIDDVVCVECGCPVAAAYDDDLDDLLCAGCAVRSRPPLGVVRVRAAADIQEGELVSMGPDGARPARIDLDLPVPATWQHHDKANQGLTEHDFFESERMRHKPGSRFEFKDGKLIAAFDAEGRPRAIADDIRALMEAEVAPAFAHLKKHVSPLVDATLEVGEFEMRRDGEAVVFDGVPGGAYDEGKLAELAQKLSELPHEPECAIYIPGASCSCPVGPEAWRAFRDAQLGAFSTRWSDAVPSASGQQPEIYNPEDGAE